MSPHETFHLRSRNIKTVSDADQIFGEDTSVIVARPGRERCSLFWFTIPEGFYALVTRHGSDEDFGDGKPIWPSGLHLGPPWLKVSHLVTKQAIIFNIPFRDCKTKDNVSVEIDLALVIRIMGDEDPYNVRKFVHDVTAEGLQAQLMDASAEAIRTLARSVMHTEVFGLRTVKEKEKKIMKTKRQGFSPVVPTVPLSTASLDPTEQISLEGNEDVECEEEEKDLIGDHDITMGKEKEMTKTKRQGFSPVSPRVYPTVPLSTDSLDPTEKISFEGNEGGEDEEEEKDLIGDHDIMDEEEAGFNVEYGASVLDKMKDRLNAQFKPQGVEIVEIIVKRIRLPKYIQKQMSTKTMVISQNAEQRMQQRYDMLTLRQREEMVTLDQTHMEQKIEIQEDGDFRLLQEQLGLQLDNEYGEQSLKEIKTQMAIDVGLVHAESNLTVSRRNDQSILEAGKIRLEADFEAAKSLQAANAKVRHVESNTNLQCAKFEAKGDKKLFTSYGESAPKIRTFNEHTTKKHRLAVQDALASNEKLIITGISGGEAANQILLVDAALSDTNHLDMDGAERTKILSELAVASGRAYVRLKVDDTQQPKSDRS